jgi:hypothetical protein
MFWRRSNLERSFPADQDDQQSALETTFARILSGRYGTLSRRSFLSAATRRIIALAGVPIVAQVFPYFAGTAKANTLCGLHGYWCGYGTCNTSAGAAIADAWVQCCDVAPCPVTYRCCTYRDYCGTRPANWGNATCLGPGLGSGSTWCGATPGDYVCTTVNCSPTVFSTLSACATNCGGAKC